jgi:DNA-binding LacI/PurR family transcriptional regulator/C4-dicarboxylate-specific signal transduction histidine kinase
MAIGIFAHSDGVFQNPILLGAREAIREHHTNLLIYRSPTMTNYSGLDAASIRSQYKVDQNELEGLILSFAAPGLTEYGLSLFRAGLPVISIGRSLEELPHLLLENRSAIRDIVLDLASRGHRDIAYLSGPMDNQCARDRWAGYCEGRQRAGLGEDPRLVLNGGFEESPGFAATKNAWERGLRFSALVCANDMSAIGAVKALKELGCSIPQDVEVTGFDNSIVCQLSQPTLSTFSTNNFELGYFATDLLVRATRGEPLPTSTTIPVDFVARQSTRTPVAASGQLFAQSDIWSLPPREKNLWLARLGNVYGAASALRQLGECSSEEALMSSATSLLGMTEKSGIPPACLYETIASAGNPSSELTALSIARALDQLHETILRQEYIQAQLNAQFIAHTARLRQFTIQPTDENILLEEMKRVLWDLGVPHAKIYLTAEASTAEAGLYNAVEWTKVEALAYFREVRRPLTNFSTQIMMRNQGAAIGSWMVVPLIFHELQYGVAVVSRETPHEFWLPELIQQFSTAIYTNRVHRALALANLDLEKSRNAAEAANAALKKAQSKLIEASRLAGVAEMATSILHNIGNALTSVNTSANLAIDHLRGIKFKNLAQTIQLIEQHRPELDRFMREDPRGKTAFDYLKLLSQSFLSEQEALTGELNSVRDGIERVNGIVAAQQGHADVSGVVEEFAPTEIIESAVQFCESTILLHKVNLVQEITPMPSVRIQRQKAIQILINLLTNANAAVMERPSGERQITLQLRPAGEKMFQIVVEDNGVGIAKDNLTRIFAFGFTSPDGSPGSGLHNSALAAYEMKGSLIAKSAGEGKGATFILELPVAETPSDHR